MPRRIHLAALILGFCHTLGLHAQEQRPTLPEVEVRPPSDVTEPPTSDAAGESPLVDVPIESAQAAPMDLPLSQPLTSDFNAEFNPPSSQIAPGSTFATTSVEGLFDQQLGQPGPFGQNTGVLRGGLSVFDAPAAISIRSRREITERQAPDMFQALQNEVGVLIQSTAAGQASPFVRGLTGQQVLILIDGIRLNNSITRRGPNQYFNTIDPGMVDHIEVERGQGSVLWGSDAIGGVINVVTRGADRCCGLRDGGYARTLTSSSSSAPCDRVPQAITRSAYRR